MIAGYARVPTLELNEDLQTGALNAAGCERLFTDHAGGAKASRPELDHMLDVPKSGLLVFLAAATCVPGCAVG